MAGMLETPSRVWRRIDAAEGADMPSLPSLPAFEDSAGNVSESEAESDNRMLSTVYSEPEEDLAPVQSTPAPISSRTMASTARMPSSTSSTTRFASSIASRSANGRSGNYGSASLSGATSASAIKGRGQESFDASAIPSLPDSTEASGDEEREMGSGRQLFRKSKDSVPDMYLPPEEEAGEPEYSLTDALESVSRTGSPFAQDLDERRSGRGSNMTPKKAYDYSVALRSEPKASPVDKYRNVNMRKASGLPRTNTRTPSLSRTTPSPESSASLESIPHSTRSAALPSTSHPSPADITLPRSATASPVLPTVVIQRPNDDAEQSNPNEYEESLMEQQPEELGQSEEEYDFHNYQDREPSEREPTFSSSEGQTPPIPAPNAVTSQSPSVSVQLSSSAPSIALTPTPANPPRPRLRARFPLPSLTGLIEDEDDHRGPITPYSKKKSFLIDVINSNAKPRMKFGTPHPRYSATPRTGVNVETDGENDSTPTAVPSRIAFAGVTPRPGIRTGRRSSHPLAQAYIPTASPEPQDLRSDIISPQLLSSDLHPSSLQTPTPFSPYNPSSAHDSDRASFISTASSHDLTAHAYARANASFDPAMGFGDRGIGMDRFNQGKLISYMHGLNRRLAEENEVLVSKCMKLEDESKAFAGVNSRRFSGGVRRLSAGGSNLDDVAENVNAEGWAEEKKELEEMVDVLTDDINKCNAAKAESDKALHDEKEERRKDKEKWKDRMSEVEKGVEVIIKDLEEKMEEANRNARELERGQEHLRRDLESVGAERDLAIQRAEKAEQVLNDGRELGGELKEANDRVALVLGDLRNANNQIKQLEEEVLISDARVDELENQLRDERALVSKFDQELTEAKNNLTLSKQEVKEIKQYAATLEADTGIAEGRIEDLEAQISLTKGRLFKMDALEEKVDQLEAEAAAKADFARQMEEALESAERKMLEDEEKVAHLLGRVASLECDKKRQQAPTDSSKSLGPDVDVAELENELDDANREIARLNTLLNQSPARRAIDKAKDARIEMLEKEKDDLLDRVKSLRNTMNDMGTPNRILSGTGISPIHRQVLNISMRTPRTPGAPLRDMSWLNNTTADPSLSPLVAEINRLQHELDRANESIDDKLDRLEDAGLGVVGLTKKLEDARARILSLEDEIARLSRREDRRIRRLERARCQKCHVKVDWHTVLTSTAADESSFEVTNDHLPTEPPTPPTRTSEALKANLSTVVSQLDTLKQQWTAEKQHLLGEKAVLKDAAKRLNAQIRNAKDEIQNERAKAGSQGELDNAKRTIAELEGDLQSERGRLRTLTTEQNRIHRQKEDLLLQLRRTESDMDDVKRQLQKFKDENHELENELRMNANVEQKARLLEARVSENAATIEQLRQERSLLVSDHKDLQYRFSEISERASKLREEHATSRNSHDKRRHQLDVHLVEIEELRRALSNQADELQRSEEERNRVASQKNSVALTVTQLETDLKRVRRDAENFGRDLKNLRVEKERWDARQKEEVSKSERARKQAQTQIRLLNEQLDGQREKTHRAKEELRAHVCASIDDRQIAAIKLQHNKECKGLIVQIRYLKAKFTRESCFRSHLGYQKQFLLVLLTKFEKSEQRTLKSIARIGYPTVASEITRRPRSLKSAALSVIFILRARRASDVWHEYSVSKSAVAAALQDVRRRRAAPAWS